LKTHSILIKPLLKHIIAGALIGILVLHPLTMVIYWFDFNPPESFDHAFWEFAFERLVKSFTGEMFTMAILFLLLGGILGLASGVYYQALNRRDRLIRYLKNNLTEDLKSVIKKGEGETIEFKASVRWNYRDKKIDKTLETAVIKTIAGYMNHQGGTLLIGVDNKGAIVGLDDDYATFKRKDRDGLEQYLMGAVSSRLGTDICPLVHILFHEIEGKDVCRVIAEMSSRPVYVRGGSKVRYFLRTGNATRELNVREAMEHVVQRWPKYQSGF